MSNRLKALGLALAATFALGAIGAGSASAENGVQDLVTLDAGETAVITGVSHDNVFKAGTGGAAKFECTTSVFSATVKDNAKTVDLDTTYTGKINETPHGERCTGPGSPLITMNGCGYTIDGETSQGDPKESGNTHAPVWITCPPEKEITIDTTLGCTLHIPAQTPTEGGLTFQSKEEANGKWDVLATATVTGITYTATGGFCSFVGLHAEGQDGVYNGTATITAYEDVAKHSTWQYTEGSQVGITMSS